MRAKPIEIAIIAAGSRGFMFAGIVAGLPHLARVVAVAEPRLAERERFVREFGLDPEMAFKSWEAFFARERMCDAVVVATMDREHAGPAVAALERGYHLLLEKPLAPTLEECLRIEAAALRSEAITAVCHSLRYHKGFARLKEVVAGGRLGSVVTIDQLEQIQFTHFSHSFVRGNWGNIGRAAFTLLAKSCHDLDYIAHLMDTECRRVSSYGSLSYFKAENAPAGATERCADGCAVEAQCPYSALKIYPPDGPEAGWGAMIPELRDPAERLEALRASPFGRCVFHADNDALDHQVVAMEFDGGATATFTMTAFTQEGGRRIRVHGTLGEAAFDEQSLTVRTFADGNVETVRFGPEAGGHGGGDGRVARAWLDAIRLDERDRVLTAIPESARTHRIVFAAERARLEGRAVEMQELLDHEAEAGHASAPTSD